jgi:hypothetical protein
MIPLLAALAICQIPGIPVPNPTPLGDPFIVTIRDLRQQPIPPNPIRVIAPIILVDKGVMIGDSNDTIWVMGVPTEAAVGISVGATMDVTGRFNGSAIMAQKWIVYFSESDSVYREMIGTTAPDVPDPVTIYGKKTIPLPATVRGTVSFKAVPIEVRVSADYSDLFGRSYTSTLVDRSAWVVDVDKFSLSVTQGSGSWVGEFARVKQSP